MARGPKPLKAAAVPVPPPTHSHQCALRAEMGSALVVGVDEVGRGPMAGPVVAAACHVPEHLEFTGLRDSKRMSKTALVTMAARLQAEPRVRFAIASVSAEQIESQGIGKAVQAAMRAAIAGVAGADAALIDGLVAPAGLEIPTQCVVRGDSACVSIAAAAVLAKVGRDQYMTDLAKVHPGYGFERNAGYGTPAHIAAVRARGLCAEHRASFWIKQQERWAIEDVSATVAALVD